MVACFSSIFEYQRLNVNQTQEVTEVVSGDLGGLAPADFTSLGFYLICRLGKDMQHLFHRERL